ncbi:putative outer membrane pmp2 domain protein, partial [Chlamydia psittaci 84-8471/1]
EILTFQVR